MHMSSLIEKLLGEFPVTLFDAGARGGVEVVKRLAPWIHAYGFEPHPASFQDIPSGAGHYASQSYFPLALGEQQGIRSLHLTKHPSYSSFLEADLAIHQRHLQFMPRYPQWKEFISPISRVEVEVNTLDAEAARLGVEHISLLKLDTQGTELEILKGASRLLGGKRIGLIRCEVSFIPFYKGQCLFGDISGFLKKYGYSFVDCLYYPEIEYDCAGGQRSTPVRGVRECPHFAMGGDAIFYQPSPDDEKAAIASGLILAEMGYYSPAYSILTEHSGLNAAEVSEILRLLFRETLIKRLKRSLKHWLPPAIQDWIKN